MIKNLLLTTFTSIAFFNAAYSQVLYNETFNTYNLGNLGTDPTGAVPGQGGWYTEGFTKTSRNNYLFTISSEANKGRVLVLSSDISTPTNEYLHVKKTDLNKLIDQRTAGNNVIKFEIDYYTGAQHQQAVSSSGHQQICLSYDPAVSLNESLVIYTFQSTTGSMGAISNGNNKLITLDNNTNKRNPIVPFNTWVTFIVYLDYNTKKAYFETPYFNAVAVADFLSQSTSNNLIEDFKPTVLTLAFGAYDQKTTANKLNKYDNIKITALKSIPPHVLSSPSFLSQKFSIYPNPATDIVNITNTENLSINQIEVYDLSGKLINSQTFNVAPVTRLNVENLPSGSYILHLKTNEGIAVKKLIKQ